MNMDDEATLVDLPFPVQCGPRSMWTGGGDVEIRIACSSDAPEMEPFMTNVFQRFVALARSGALAGDSIAPWHSGVSIAPGSGYRNGAMVLKLHECRIHAGAFFVLLNMLLPWHRAYGITSVQFVSPGPEPSHLHLDSDDEEIFPPMYERLPFELVDDEPESGAYTFTAHCVSPVDEMAAAALASALNLWVEVVRTGGYEMCSMPPSSSYVEPGEGGLITFGQTLEWTVFKLRADPDSVDGVVNMFVAYHHRGQPLESLEIT